MIMAKKKKDDSVNSKPTIFTILKYITVDKKPYGDLEEAERKAISPYMLNRLLSMDMGLLPVIAELQKYTSGVLTNKEVYILYSELLPKKSFFSKYIKSKNEDVYNPELIKYIILHLSISKKECIEYLDILSSMENYKIMMTEFLQSYAVSEKEIAKILK